MQSQGQLAPVLAYLEDSGFDLFIASTAMTVAIIFWSTKTLHSLERGKELATTEAFRYFRHPLYSDFLAFFNLGLDFLVQQLDHLI